jgi:hypothetical protein
MSRYLNIAQQAVHTNETHDRHEESPVGDRVAYSTKNERNEIHEKSRRRLSCAEALAIGLNPDLVWIRVSKEVVEASAPPPGWNGILPGGCRWSQLCQTLGPCPHPLQRGACNSHYASE